MPRIVIFIFLYGALFMFGVFLSLFWGKVARLRLRVIEHSWRHDGYFILAASLFFFALGAVLVNVGRAIGNVLHGPSPILERPEGLLILSGLAFTLIGASFMVWLADLEKRPPTWFWLKVMGALTLVWLAVTLIIAPFTPLDQIWPELNAF